MSQLASALDDAIDGRGSLVAITGQPGIGKTRLTGELGMRAAAAGALVLSARGSGLESAVPYAMVVDALCAQLAALDPRRLERLAPHAAALARIFPALSRDGGSAGKLGALDDAVRALLEALADERPTMVVLDDVHRADPASLGLVLDLVEHPLPGGLLVLLAYREAGAPGRLVEAVGSAEGAGRLRHVELPALDEHDAARLVGDGIPPEALRPIFRASGGNPFYLLELCRAPRSASDGEEPAVPPAVLTAIREELEGLRAAAQGFLQAAAVLGDPFDPRLAAEVAESPYAGASALREACATGLIVAAEEGERFRFRQPIVHSAVYETAGAGWRIGAHARAASLLEAHGASPAERADHIERSAVRGDDAAIATLMAAAGDAASHAPAAAARWYRAGLRLLPEGVGRERRVPLLLRLADALIALGHVAEARGVLKSATEYTPLQRASGAAPEAREIATLDLDLAIGHLFMGAIDEVVRHANAARDRAEQLAARDVQAAALAVLAHAEVYRGRVDVARTWVVEADALMSTLSDRELAGQLPGIWFLSSAHYHLERLDDSARWLQRAAQVARDTGQHFWLAATKSGQAYVRAMIGELREAEQLAESARADALALDSDMTTVLSIGIAAWIATLRGDLTRAQRLGEEGVASAQRTATVFRSWLPGCVLGGALIRSGNIQTGIAAILEHGGGRDLSAVEPSYRSWLYDELAMAEFAREDHAAAADYVRRCEEAARPLGLTGPTGMALRARAKLAYIRGEYEEAAEIAARAAEELAAAGLRIDAARAQTLTGQTLASAGSPDRAVEWLESAYTTFEACGADKYADHAAAILGAIGRRPARRTNDSGTNGALAILSPRQLEVARLVATGLTNRQIADRLLVGRKTVETHLSHVFEKLGVSSRAEVAREVERAQASDRPRSM